MKKSSIVKFEFSEPVVPLPNMGSNPGSPEACVAGCICPRYDNANGRGRGKDEHGNTVFVQRGDCPHHGKESR